MGYCECRDGKRMYEANCNGQFSFTCELACAGDELCAWRQTGGCTAQGPREPGNDKPCNAMIEAGSSGYCECGSEHRRTRETTCDGQDKFTCLEACSLILLEEDPEL